VEFFRFASAAHRHAGAEVGGLLPGLPTLDPHQATAAVAMIGSRLWLPRVGRLWRGLESLERLRAGPF